jgi:hypothetical protein
LVLRVAESVICLIPYRLRQEKRISHIAADATHFAAAGEDFSGVFGAGDRQDIGRNAEAESAAFPWS